MMKLIGYLILFFIIISIGPALLQKFLGSLNPIGWILDATKKASSESVEKNAECLKAAARQNGLAAEAQAQCGTKTGTAYIVCMQDFLSAQPLGKDYSSYCAGKNTQQTIQAVPRNLATQKACSYIPWWVPDLLEKLVGLGDCVSEPAPVKR
jgi:hypothetical protein